MPAGRTKRETIAIVTYPGVALLELVAAKTVLDGLAMGFRYRVVTVGETVERVRTNTPMAIIPEKRFEDVPDPYGLVVPGGGIASLEAMGNERLLDYLRFAAYGARIISSVSTGAFVLAAAGLLDGRRATTHPSYGDLLTKLGVDYVDSYAVEDGKFLTTGGVSGGIDKTLQLVANLTSEVKAKRIQTMIEYDPEPPFGAIDWSAPNGDGLAETLNQHRTDLEKALASRPDLIQKLFS